MATILGISFEQPLAFVGLAAVSIYLLWTLQITMSNIYFHALSKFPGPKLAAASRYYKAYIEGVQQISWHIHLQELHARYGPIVRVGPNELHFSEPQAYHDIYNNSNRWDKEETLYHSFGEDRSSFGFLTYRESKERKDVLNKSFSARAILEAQGIVQSKIDELCSVFNTLSKTDQPVNLSYAFRCMSMDIITTYCFGTSISAIQTPGFKAPIIIAMDAAASAFLWFKHSTLYKNMIIKCPRPLSRVISPPTVGLVDLQEILSHQITNLTARPETLDQLSHRQTIYHSLLDPTNYKNRTAIPSSGSLYEEAQALMFAGADTVGNTLMVMAFHLSQPQNRHFLDKLQTELRQAYPNANGPPPPLSRLETLPYLNATIKESLRLFSGVISGLPRIVPQTGATISQTSIPAGTIVSISSVFVHYNATIFPDPKTFNPNRWLRTSSSSPPFSSPSSTGTKHSNLEPDHNLVPFSRGPRSCLGINLAWMELRLATASVFRKFEFQVDKSALKELEFRDRFLPEFIGGPVIVRAKSVV